MHWPSTASALFNVIFQKQGEVTASLLPQALTGYSFLFPTDRDLNKAHELRGGLTAPPLTLSVEGDGAMQLAAQRIALNLHEAGFNVQVVEREQCAASLIWLCASCRSKAAIRRRRSKHCCAARDRLRPSVEQDPAALFKAEREFLDRHTLVPLLDLPRAYAIGGRVRDLQLHADGSPDLAGASLEDAP